MGADESGGAGFGPEGLGPDPNAGRPDRTTSDILGSAYDLAALGRGINEFGEYGETIPGIRDPQQLAYDLVSKMGFWDRAALAGRTAAGWNPGWAELFHGPNIGAVNAGARAMGFLGNMVGGPLLGDLLSRGFRGVASASTGRNADFGGGFSGSTEAAAGRARDVATDLFGGATPAASTTTTEALRLPRFSKTATGQASPDQLAMLVRELFARGGSASG